MIGGTTVLLTAAALSVVVWGAAALVFAGPITAQRRAGAVFGLAVSQPLVLLLLSTRTMGAGGALSVVPPRVNLLGQAMNGLMVGLGVTLLILPARRVDRRGGFVLGGVWAMCIALFASDTLSPSPGSIKYEFYFAIAVTAVVFGVSDGAAVISWTRRVLRAVVAISLGAAVVAPAWAFIGKGGNGYDRTVAGVPRLTGLSPHPNALSAIAVMALLVEIGVAHGSRVTRALAVGAAGICIVLTQSNTGYVAAAIGVTVVLAVRHPVYRRLFAGAAVALLALYVFVPRLLIPSSLAGSDYVTSVSGRATIWQLSLREWRHHPLTGYGPNMFSPGYLSSHFPPGLQATNAHDQFVQTLADSGLLGLAGLTAVVLGSIACAWKARKFDGGLALSVVAAFWTFSLTETPMRVVGVGALAAIGTLAIAVAGSRQDALATVTSWNLARATRPIADVETQ